MNNFVVCFLQVSCSRLIQPVEVYTNWYMMWYQKIYVLQGTYLFRLIHHFLNGLSIVHILVGLAIIRWSGHCPLFSGHVPHKTHSRIPRMSLCSHVRTLILAIVRMII